MYKKIIFLFTLLILILSSPFLIWLFQEKQSLSITLINKSVATAESTNHEGIYWTANYLNLRSDTGKAYRTSEDYYGYHPSEDSIITLPETLDGEDLIYISDTAGVYQEDRMIDGGLTAEEWLTIQKPIYAEGADLVVEFSSLSHPTAEEVSNDLSRFLELQSTGWNGKYIFDLNKEESFVPESVITQYESLNENDWSFTGEGFILVHGRTDKIVVLSLDEGDLEDSDLRISFNDYGEELFSLSENFIYEDWFALVIPEDEESAAADFNWSLSENGKNKLEEENIPLSFPAILHHMKGSANIYYFAGNFSKSESLPFLYQYKGLATLYTLVSNENSSSVNHFYWTAFMPMFKEISTRALDEAPELPPVNRADYPQEDELAYASRINGEVYEVYDGSEWKTITIKGVNLGMAKPSVFPGQAALMKNEYIRWFEQIGEMNANTVRIYTIHPPEFYQALSEYNQEAEEPIYLFHGVWIDEEPLEKTLDAFTPEITETFQNEMRTIVDIVHGNAVIEKQPGHASGIYTTDVSPYVIGWMLGIEWYPEMVDHMKDKYVDLPDYDGEYVRSENGDGIEIWLAEQMDVIATYEAENYQWMRPLSFTNWVSTDLLDHPAEPSEQEDLATVNPNLILPNGALLEAGMFASYHVYPYYPDFLNLEEKYTEFIDHRGEKNNYAGYIKDLHDAHDLPVLIAEFGIPASRGLTHENPFGWNQGFVSEKEQGEFVVHLFEDILAEEMLGGLVFTWQDEWFKRTWNTMDYDNPDRRPFWSNAQTNEQHFGLLSFDRLKIKPDDSVEDWNEAVTIYESTEEEAVMKNLSFDFDERYLYAKIDLSEEVDEAWFENNALQLYFSIREDEGIEIGSTLDESALATEKADFRLSIDSPQEGVLEIAGDYDTFFYDYSEGRNDFYDYDPNDFDSILAAFQPIRLALNKEMIRPDTGELLPFTYYETGALRGGIGNPEDEAYDSLSDFHFSEEANHLEIRIAWMLLNSKDPSKGEFLGDFWSKEELEASFFTNKIGAAAAVYDRTSDKHVETFPAAFEEILHYEWELWNDTPQYEERLKQSYYILQEKFAEID